MSGASMVYFKARNLATILFIGFVNYWEWTVLLASIYPYIVSMKRQQLLGEKPEVYFALAQSAFPLGQGLSLPGSTKLMKRLGQIKGAQLLLVLIAICGNVVYIAAKGTNRLLLVVLGRSLAGLGAGSGGVAYGFLTANTAGRERVRYIRAYRSVCMLGILLATLSSATFLPTVGSTVVGVFFGLDQYSSPAAFSILLLTLSLAMTVFLLDEEDCEPTDQRETQVFAAQLLKLQGVNLVLLLFFFTGFMTTWVTYVMPLVVFPLFDWPVTKFAWLLLGAAAAAVIGSLSAPSLARTRLFKSDGQWKIIVLSCSLQLVGVALCFMGEQSGVFKAAFREASFISGATLVFMMYSVCGVALPALASRYISQVALPVFLPYCLVLMSAGKFVAPLLALAELRVGNWVLMFSLTAGFIVLVLVAFPCMYRRRRGSEDERLLPKTCEHEATAVFHPPDLDESQPELECTASDRFPKDSNFTTIRV